MSYGDPQWRFAHRISPRPETSSTNGAKEVVTRFVGAEATLDYLVDRYKLGFYHDSVRNL